LPSNTPDPAAIYAHIYNRLLECQAMGEKMPAAEASLSFSQLMTACSQLISENEKLRRAVAISEQITQDLEIEMAVKDIELFSYANHTPEKD
jgi:hypothetical protein